jgi:stress response protein SCP2
LKDVNNAECKVYNDETDEVLASYKMTENGGDNTAIVVGVVTDKDD